MESNKPPVFAPGLGAKVLLNPLGQEEKHSCYFLGMEPERYVITSLGRFSREINTITQMLPKGSRARLFSVHRGVMHAYLVRILGFATTPYHHLYLSYPDRNESLNLRRFDRVDCHLPASLGQGPDRVRGMVDNISQGGCRLQVAPEDARALLGLDMDAGHAFQFQLNTRQAPCRARCTLVTRDEASGGLLQAGLRFDELEEDDTEALDHFIAFVIRHRS